MEYDFYFELYSSINSSNKYLIHNMKTNQSYFTKNYTKKGFFNKIKDMNLSNEDKRTLYTMYRNSIFGI